MIRPVSPAGKVIAITGAARGIGLATATVLRDSGARVAIGDVDESAVHAAGSRLGLAVHRRLDVTDRQSFTDFLDSVETELGPLDVLVNNAGVIAVGSAFGEADAATRRLLDVNVYGVILGTKLAAQRMLPRRRGHIINIASLGAVVPAPGIATYCATKHAVLGFTDTVRLENRGSGLHFSAVLPTLVNTDMIAGLSGLRGMRNAEPEDVARAVAALITKPKARVMVPRSLNAVRLAQKVMPLAAFEALSRGLGAESVFGGQVDAEKRKRYTERPGTFD
jgi:NAD(P)-dependent dehydrogenase (short-subunit alcohol dehydrogenase family)